MSPPHPFINIIILIFQSASCLYYFGIILIYTSIYYSSNLNTTIEGNSQSMFKTYVTISRIVIKENICLRAFDAHRVFMIPHMRTNCVYFVKHALFVEYLRTKSFGTK